MLNLRIVLEEEYRNRKDKLEKYTWSDILKKGFDICEMEASFGPEEKNNA